eukprot:TRINITY_DN3629_c0_g1_i2.p2 TRINITY_DN3629_c0_g1~~TRINITY_DN3629_c0_g1_i2.p2  ORF type:complete len:284 (-),score=31.31 TRINITY_DN3629_c0_g1_i2:1099-1950(-)
MEAPTRTWREKISSVKNWSINEVFEWAIDEEGGGISEIHAIKLKEQEVNGKALLTLSKEDFTKCGILVGPSSLLVTALSELKTKIQTQGAFDYIDTVTKENNEPERVGSYFESKTHSNSPQPKSLSSTSSTSSIKASVSIFKDWSDNNSIELNWNCKEFKAPSDEFEYPDFPEVSLRDPEVMNNPQIQTFFQKLAEGTDLTFSWDSKTRVRESGRTYIDLELFHLDSLISCSAIEFKKCDSLKKSQKKTAGCYYLHAARAGFSQLILYASDQFKSRMRTYMTL